MSPAYAESHRGYRIEVVHESLVRVTDFGTGLNGVTVAQCRRMVDHFLDRGCASHDARSCTGDAGSEWREHGALAGVDDGSR